MAIKEPDAAAPTLAELHTAAFEAVHEHWASVVNNKDLSSSTRARAGLAYAAWLQASATALHEMLGIGTIAAAEYKQLERHANDYAKRVVKAKIC